jgi:flagellar biosynthetic protein FlhB
MEGFDPSKTEAPTQRHREEARQQGQVALSAELAAGSLLLAGVVALALGGPSLASGLLQSVRLGLGELKIGEFSAEQARLCVVGIMSQGGQLLGLFLGLLFAVALAVGVLQAGFHVVPELILPRWEKLSPATGWGRIVSLSAGMRGVLAFLKVSVVALVAAWVLRGRLRQIGVVGQGSLSAAAVEGWNLALRLALAVAAALALLGVIDYLFQWWRHEQSLRMTRQELKDETKREEGDPAIRARIRKHQREVDQQQMLRDVPRATVVVTNPTHLAVALRYERGTMPAPRVVAKGAGFVALRIAALARRHAVPVVERKPVAQALYKAVKVGQEIPSALFLAVAEILAYVMRLRGSVSS